VWTVDVQAELVGGVLAVADHDEGARVLNGGEPPGGLAGVGGGVAGDVADGLRRDGAVEGAVEGGPLRVVLVWGPEGEEVHPREELGDLRQVRGLAGADAVGALARVAREEFDVEQHLAAGRDVARKGTRGELNAVGRGGAAVQEDADGHAVGRGWALGAF